MSKYIDADLLRRKIAEQMESLPREVGRGAGTITSKGYGMMEAFQIVRSIIDSLQQDQDMGEVSDGYHTFNELYYYRMLYNAAFFNLLPKGWVHKSKRHHTGEECFGGGWFIVMANLPTGQVSNHYELKDWDLFQVPEKEFADEWDGHTSQEAAKRLYEYLQQEQPSLPDNLDEAAEETAQKYYCSCLEKHNETGICDGCENVKLSFKAGAEWMAEQGVNK